MFLKNYQIIARCYSFRMTSPVYILVCLLLAGEINAILVSLVTSVENKIKISRILGHDGDLMFTLAFYYTTKRKHA